MRWIIYVALVTLTMLVPVKRADVAFLEPVEIVSLSSQGEKLILETDTGEMGMGETVDEAVNDLLMTADGIIYLDTARYLLVEKGMAAEIEPMKRYLKDKTRLWEYTGTPDLASLAPYLDVQDSPFLLEDWVYEG